MRYSLLLSSFCFVSFYNVLSQADTLVRIVAKQEAINLNLLWYSINYGTISWEKSVNGTNWSPIPEETTKNYHFNADSDAYFRAKVNAGTCDPFYSKIVKINVLNISTDSVTNVTETEAVVHCASFVDTGLYIERGILYDTKTVPDMLSTRITDTTEQPKFCLQIRGLQQGVTYYTRIYVKDQAGTYYYGNIQTFSTQKIYFTNIVNAEKTSLQIFYNFSATPIPSEHGIFFSPSPGLDTTANRIQGTLNGNYFASWMDFCRDYFICTAIYDSEWPLLHRKGKSGCPMSDYSTFPVNTDPFSVGHKIVGMIPHQQKNFTGGLFRGLRTYKKNWEYRYSHTGISGGPNNGDWVNVVHADELRQWQYMVRTEDLNE
jgi:hypothetical protein